MIIFILFIIQIQAQYTANNFNELCSTKHPDQFEEKMNQFKNKYSKSCPTGMYYGFNGTNILCMKCIKGNYIRNDYICCNCGIGAISTEDNSYSCIECEQKYGANKDNTKCVICPTGTYSTNKGSGCISCGKGKYTEHEGSTYCLNCPKGEGVNKEGNGCEKCPLGYYSNSEGIGCLKCNNGSISTTIGSTKCQPCTIGSGANNERTECDLCTAGLVSEKEGDGCHFCDGNGKASVAEGMSKCASCPAGSYFEPYYWYSFDEEGNPYWDDKGKYTYIACVRCKFGYYGPGSGEGCLKCPKGSIAPTVGSLSCINCTKGYGSNEEGSLCVRCTSGQYSKYDGFGCEDCDIGAISKEGAEECTKCPKGKGRNSKGNECIECQEGYYSPEEGSGCLKCPYGSISTKKGSISCTKCKAGYGSNYERTNCEICPKGYYSIEGSGCLSCENNTYSNKEGNIQCEICPNGSGVNSNHTECNICPNGTYSNEKTKGLCLGCGNGAIVKEGTNNCTKCKEGHGSNQEGTECIKCQPGYYSSKEGLGCYKCPYNTYSSTNGSLECIKCPQGSGSIDGSFECYQCPLGYYSIGEGKGCIQCDSGAISTEYNSTNCTKCPKGYGANKERTQCEICQPGYYSDKEGSGCILCPENTYSDKEGSYECMNCSAGYGGTSDRTRCEICQPGYYSSTNGSSCIICEYSMYSDIYGATECLYCPFGYQVTDDQTGCKYCEAGKYSNNETGGWCQSCPLGQYSDIGSIECFNCSAGSSSIAGDICFTCLPGYYSPTNGSDCLQCPIDTYSNRFGSSECLPCPNGMTTKGSVGQTSCKCSLGCADCSIIPDKDNKPIEKCSSCLPGYSYMNGKCDICPAGYYSEGGVSVCEVCPENTWSRQGRYKCTKCSDNCINCDKTIGSCIKCDIGYHRDITSANCEVCDIGTYQTNGSQSSCIKCPEMTYTNKIASSICKSCDLSCTSCNRKTGECTSCKEGWVLDGMICSECPSGSYANRLKSKECIKCPKGEYQSLNGQNKCIQCPKLQYQDSEGSIECKKCSSLCKTECNSTTGHCLDCISGYELNKEIGECIECSKGYYSDYSTNNTCIKCPKGTYCSNTKCTRCEKCYGNSYSSNEGSSQCSNCDSSCKTCDNTNGKCLSCKKGYGISSDGMKCEKCKINEYSNNNECHQCPDGLTSEEVSAECKGTQEIPKCNETNTIPYHYECVACDKVISNCLECSYDSTQNKSICTKCYSPYEVNKQTNECDLCQPNYHYSSSESKCIQNKENCEEQIEEECQRCKLGYTLTQGNCILEEGECHIKTNKTCEECINSNQMTISGICKTINNCKYSFDNKCMKCNNVYENKEGVCQINDKCSLYIDDECMKTSKENLYINTTTNEIKECENADVCQMNDNEMKIYKCSENYYQANETCQTKEESNCSITETGDCLKCEDKMFLDQRECHQNNITNCKNQNKDKCIECEEGYILSFGKCILISDLNCIHYDSTTNKCYQCNETTFYKDQEGCLPKITSIYEKCKIQKTSTSECFECEDGYELNNGQCEAIESEENINLKREEKEDICIQQTNKGCIRCSNGYYLDNYECKECPYPCEKCSNLTYCTGCNSYSILENGKCISMNTMIKTCDNMWPNNKGCITCKDGYYKAGNGQHCEKCHYSCQNCFDANTCLTCSDNYYMIPESNQKLCKSYKDLIGCINTTKSGCNQCKDGMYLSRYECHNCSKECTTCTNNHQCQSCQNEFILKEQKCIHYTEIKHCLLSNNSVCVLCDEFFELNDKQNECKIIRKYLLIFILICCLVAIAIVIVVLFMILVMMKIIDKSDEYKQLINLDILKISEMDIQWTKLNPIIQSNKKIIDFTDNYGELSVNRETKETIILGNRSKRRQRIQIVAKDSVEKYRIKTIPDMISLKKGEAFEFEIKILPLCSCEIEDELLILSVDIRKATTVTVPLKIFIKTQPSTYLDFDQLEFDEMLGEGSFGVVYLGHFKRNKVAIKMMKLMDDDSSIDEFEKEVSMLDKFRSEYIVHFYGACFIPMKLCIVTEFAQFGSLQNYIETHVDNPLSTHMKTKLMLDVSKGISYLHSNDILHRDIKPDNVLLFSLDKNIPVNCKLTDFGSARNINALMTNLTFTKGIGTPIFMAPEVINHNKYKKPADIYSFSIMMYATFGWCDAFPRNKFRHPWIIAEFISNGKRLPQIDSLTNKQYQLIEQCWTQDPKQRLKISTITKRLQSELLCKNELEEIK